MRNTMHHVRTRVRKRRNAGEPGGIHLLLARMLGALYTAFILMMGIAHTLPWTRDRGLAAGVLCTLVLVLVWSRPRWGAVLFFLLAAASAWFFRTYVQLAPFIIVTVPLVLTSLFFLLASFHKNQSAERWNFEDTAGVDS